MKKFNSKGIIRNKFQILKEVKIARQKKLNRFQNVGKDQQLSQNQDNSHSLLSTTNHSSSSSNNEIIAVESPQFKSYYDLAKEKLSTVAQFQAKIQNSSKARLKSTKQSDTKQLDKYISNLASQAMENLKSAQKYYRDLKLQKSQNPVQQKVLRNMQRSLALQIRDVTKQLRLYEKQYYSKVKAYELSAYNPLIQLTAVQKQKMKDHEYDEGEMIYQTIQVEKNEQINELVSNINQLAEIYKELNQLVIDQGALIDRIDYNIQETVVHVKSANQSLKKAEEHQNSPVADRCIKILITIIIFLVIVMIWKYSKGAS